MADQSLSTRQKLFFVVIAALLSFILLEGISSSVLFVHALIVHRRPGLSSRQHVMHDPLLGWINLPNLRLTDLYGDGDDLSTNSQSHRGTKEYHRRVPAGQRRILCAGDSYTLAVGVDDDEAFCHLLGLLDPHLETVNLGEAGYGLEQIYLKYLREGAKLDHQVVLITLIEDDFNRMGGPRFLAYEKPYMMVREGKLETLNVPVPEIPAFETWFRKNGHIFQNLRSVGLGSSALNKVLGLIASNPTVGPLPRKEVVSLLIENLVAVARQRGAMPVFLYLKQDIRDNCQEESWRKFLAEELEARQVLFIDLMSEFRSLPPDELKNLYHPRWKHYTAEANARVARAVLARLPPLIRTPGGNRSSVSNSAAAAGQL